MTESAWYVYIVESDSGAFYTGTTTDVDRRFKEHRAGRGARFFRISPPRRVLYREKLSSQSRALQREQQIKRLSRQRKLALIASTSDGLVLES